MEAFFAYQLAPQPPYLFHDGVIRKPTKFPWHPAEKFCYSAIQHAREMPRWEPTSNSRLPTPSTYGDVC